MSQSYRSAMKPVYQITSSGATYAVVLPETCKHTVMCEIGGVSCLMDNLGLYTNPTSG